MALELSELRAFLVLADQLHFSHAGGNPARESACADQTDAAVGSQSSRPIAGTRISQGSSNAGRRDLARSRAAPVARSRGCRTDGPFGGQWKGRSITDRFRHRIPGRGLPDMLMRFRQQFPEVQVSMRDMSTPNQIEALHQGDIDVGFVRLPVESAELVTVPVLEEMLVAAIPRGMSYRKGLSDLRNEPFVVISRSSSVSFFDHLVQTCRAAGFSPRIFRK